MQTQRQGVMRDLYPLSKRFDIRHVPVDDVHTLHVEQSGNPDGVPVVLVHGGPGAPWSRHNLRVFDPEHYWVIAFDQRGSWRSTPTSCSSPPASTRTTRTS